MARAELSAVAADGVPATSSPLRCCAGLRGTKVGMAHDSSMVYHTTASVLLCELCAA